MSMSKKLSFRAKRIGAKNLTMFNTINPDNKNILLLLSAFFN